MDDAALTSHLRSVPPGDFEAVTSQGAADAMPCVDRAPTSGATARDGRVAFATLDERDAAIVRLERTRWVVAELEGVGPSSRGRLADAIDEVVDLALASRGAPSPGIASGSDRDTTLGDQLFRARRGGAAGLAIVLGPLRAAAGHAGALEPEDAATLRFLAEATRERPLVLVLDARDATTCAYADPVPLHALLLAERSTLVDPKQPSDEPPPSSEQEPACPPAPAPEVPAPAAVSAVPPPTEPGLMLELTPAPAASVAPAPTPSPSPSPAPAPAPALALELTPDPPPAVLAPTPPPSPAFAAAIAPPPPARHTAGAVVVTKEEAWRAWTLQLTAARGPQPLAVLERLFTESYMPLANALAAGLDDPRARHAHDEFAATFSKGYTDAFATFASTTKRPRMVFDAHDIAARIGRLHGARSTRVLVVDAMRWDVARMVEEQVVARLGSHASLTDELVLWSALPTTTIRQLECIARGIEALRMPATLDGDAEPPRGRTSEFVRRMRVGPREIHKLDVVEARVSSATGHVLRELPEAADIAGEAIARHAETCAPRTLLLVTGDHGFSIDRHGRARQGGASPEEVLVGAFALLVGDVH